MRRAFARFYDVCELPGTPQREIINDHILFKLKSVPTFSMRQSRTESYWNVCQRCKSLLSVGILWQIENDAVNIRKQRRLSPSNGPPWMSNAETVDDIDNIDGATDNGRTNMSPIKLRWHRNGVSIDDVCQCRDVTSILLIEYCTFTFICHSICKGKNHLGSGSR